jgi:ATP-binding cassette, subfamily B, bacterial
MQQTKQPNLLNGMSGLRSLSSALLEMYKVSPKVCSFLIVAITISGIFPGVFIKATSDIMQILSENNPSKSELLTVSFAIWGSAILIQNLVTPVILYLQSILADKLTYHIHSRLIKKANSYDSIEMFDDEEFYNDLELIKTQSAHKPLNMIVTVVGLLRDFIIMCSCLFLMYSVLDWKAGFMMICAGVNAFIFIKIQNLVWQDSLSRSKKSRFTTYLSSLAINGKFIKEIRFFGYDKYIESTYKKVSEELYSESHKNRRKIILQTIIPLLFTVGVTIFLTFNITTKIASGLLNVASIAILIQSILQLQMSVNNFGEQAGWVKGHLLFFKKYFDFINKPLRKDNLSNESRIESPINIEFKDVDFSYDNNKKVITNISLEIKHGDKIAVVGPNGAGKSTIVKLLCGLYLPSRGDILINNKSIKHINLRDWRKKISPVFQDFCTYDFTVKENIACDSEYNKLNKMLDNVDAAYLKEILDNKVGKAFGGIELSVGQWQKIAIARALYNDGDIFILDEPTASLDPNMEYEIFKTFEEIARNKTVIFVTHRLNTVVLADKIIFMDDGRILDCGTHAELIYRCKKYKEMFDKQSGGFVKLAANS